MRTTTFYLGVEKIVYKFSKQEIKTALINNFEIKQSNKMEFELACGDWEEEPPYAELIVFNEAEVEKP